VNKLFVGPIDPNENLLGELLLCPRVVVVAMAQSKKGGLCAHTTQKCLDLFF
jgi:hypothetical protein